MEAANWLVQLGDGAPEVKASILDLSGFQALTLWRKVVGGLLEPGNLHPILCNQNMCAKSEVGR